MKRELKSWLSNNKHLPEFLKDFHDQKNLFKYMHALYESEIDRNDYQYEKFPSWVTGHQYIIDWFLWFMGSRGYTLQKCRQKQEFRPIPKYKEKPNHDLG